MFSNISFFHIITYASGSNGDIDSVTGCHYTLDILRSVILLVYLDFFIDKIHFREKVCLSAIKCLGFPHLEVFLK